MEGDLPLCTACGGSGRSPLDGISPQGIEADCSVCGGTGNAPRGIAQLPPERDPRKMSVGELMRKIDFATSRMGRTNPNRLLLEQCKIGLEDLSDRLAEMINKERRRKHTQGRILT